MLAREDNPFLMLIAVKVFPLVTLSSKEVGINYCLYFYITESIQITIPRLDGIHIVMLMFVL